MCSRKRERETRCEWQLRKLGRPLLQQYYSLHDSGQGEKGLGWILIISISSLLLILMLIYIQIKAYLWKCEVLHSALSHLGAESWPYCILYRIIYFSVFILSSLYLIVHTRWGEHRQIPVGTSVFQGGTQGESAAPTAYGSLPISLPWTYMCTHAVWDWLDSLWPPSQTQEESCSFGSVAPSSLPMMLPSILPVRRSSEYRMIGLAQIPDLLRSLVWFMGIFTKDQFPCI